MIGAVTDTHSRTDGDDQALLTAIGVAFAGSGSAARASAFRGIEESELRAVFPALTVAIPGAGAQVWTAYVTARNSEIGARAWSISAGLYRQGDGATVACEAVQRSGRHVGTKVAERMVEISIGAADLLHRLIDTAGTLAAAAAPWGTEVTLKRIKSAVAGTPAADPDVLCGLAFELGRSIGEGPVTVGALMNLLGQVAGACERRTQARPLEVLLGRVLVGGWSELKATAIEDAGEEG